MCYVAIRDRTSATHVGCHEFYADVFVSVPCCDMVPFVAVQQRPRAAAIIVNGDEVALIKREHSERGKLYYLFPGGGLEHGETYQDAVVREVLEETGLEVAVDRLVAVVLHLGNPQYHYLVHIQAGQFGSGTGAEMIGQYDPSRGTYEAVWMPVNELANRPVYPRCVCDLVMESLTGRWPETPANFVDDDYG